MIHRVKEFLYVPAPEIAMMVPCEKVLRTLNGLEQSFFFPARPDIVDEGLVINLHQIFVEQTMHETILDAGNGNVPALRIVHAEQTVWSVLVGSACESGIEFIEIAFQVIDEMMEFRRALLSAHKPLPAMPKSG